MGMKSVKLDIERVVVEGLTGSGQRRFLRALEAQLHQLADADSANDGFAVGLTPNMRKRIQTLDAGPLRPGTTPENAAAQVVRAIRESVSSNRQAPSSGTNTHGGRARHDG
jgi:hypothetical protein